MQVTRLGHVLLCILAILKVKSEVHHGFVYSARSSKLYNLNKSLQEN